MRGRSPVPDGNVTKYTLTDLMVKLSKRYVLQEKNTEIFLDETLKSQNTILIREFLECHDYSKRT